MKRSELKEIESQRDYWKEFEDATGFVLIDWTHKDSASFFTPSHWTDNLVYTDLLNITGKQRDILLEKINGANKV